MPGAPLIRRRKIWKKASNTEKTEMEHKRSSFSPKSSMSVLSLSKSSKESLMAKSLSSSLSKRCARRKRGEWHFQSFKHLRWTTPEWSMTEITDTQPSSKVRRYGFKFYRQTSENGEVPNESALFNPEDHILIIGFLPTFKLACNTNSIHEGTAMWVSPCHLKVTFANALNSPMCAEDRLSPFAASNMTDLEIAKSDGAILFHVETPNMTLQNYASNLTAKLCKVTYA